PFEKLVHVTLLIPVTGKFFSELAAEKMVGLWKEKETYNDADAESIVKYLEVFKNENMKPGDAVLYTILTDGSSTVEGMIGKHGVFPEVRQCVASRLSELFS
nr:hypothetical protein [Tanacetum cinerariifolium]